MSFSCGGSENAGDASKPTLTDASEVIDEATTPQAPEYKNLSKAELEDALLSINELPVGYAQEPAEDDEDNDSYCGYEPPSQPGIKIRHDYMKGGGLSGQLISISVGQYDSQDGPEGYLRSFAKQLEKCSSQTIDGEKVTYALMSVPQLGDAAMGVRVQGESYTAAADLAQVGPVLIVVGGGGLMNLDVDQINDLFKKQVDKYVDAAKI